MDLNKPSRFGTKVAQMLGGPQQAGAYAAQPQQINQIIEASAQQAAANPFPEASIKGQFIKEYIWPALLDQQNIPPKMGSIPAANPMQAPGT